MDLDMFAVKALQLIAAGFPALSSVGGAEDVFVGGYENRVAYTRQRLGVQRGESAIGETPAVAVVVAEADTAAGGCVYGPVVAKQESDIPATRAGDLLRLGRRE